MHKIIIILFFLICTVSLSQAAIEVYSGGKHYSSFEDYQKRNQNGIVEQMKLTSPVSEVRQAPLISAQDKQKLDKISYNKGVSHVVVDFQQNWQNPKPKFVMDANELEDAIRETMKNQAEPVLLISDPKKMRIMSYAPQDNLSAVSNTEIDKSTKQ